MTLLELEKSWRSRLQEYGDQQVQDCIVRWLLGDPVEPQQMKSAHQAMEYRYRILCQRYLGVSSSQAYRHLINRLGSLTVLRNKIYQWIALSRDRQRAVADVLEEIIQEMLKRDRYLQHQITRIAQYTQSLPPQEQKRLRNSLVLATVEEYCLRPVRNQPLIVYRFVNYLRCQERSGITQVPRQELVRTVSEDSKGRLDAIAAHGEAWEEQAIRVQVQQELERHLDKHVGEVAAQWLRLYLRGHSPEAISQLLQLPIQQVYRLREKVSYYAARFAIKDNPKLIASWLEASLQDHGFGLTPSQWQEYCNSLSCMEKQLLESLKLGASIEMVSQERHWKTSKAASEWSRLYQKAQRLRNAQATSL